MPSTRGQHRKNAVEAWDRIPENDILPLIIGYCDVRTLLKLKTMSREWKSKASHEIEARLTNDTRIQILDGDELMVAIEKVRNGHWDQVAQEYGYPIGKWDVGTVENFSYAFHNYENFNAPIGEWDTTRARNMEHMFDGATAFNQDIRNWDTSVVYSMDHMFSHATSFKYNLSGWDTGSLESMDGMFDGTDVSEEFMPVFQQIFADSDNWSYGPADWYGEYGERNAAYSMSEGDY
jgi:hypothetical protein